VPTAQVEGLTLAYEESGDPHGPVALLIMGLGVQLTFWPDEFVARLGAAGFRVVRFDNRDIGLSSKLDHHGMPNIALDAARYFLRLPLRAPYLIDDMARDTEAFMDALAIERAHVVGASMGGMIAQELAARSPARVATLTSIMSTTGSRALPLPEPRALRALLQPLAPPGDVAGAARRLESLMKVIGSRTYPPVESELRAFCERQVRRSYHPAGAARQLLAIAASGDRTSNVKRIKVPTLVIHGDEDPLLRPACGEATARAIEAGGGRATLQVVKGMGHDMPAAVLPSIVDAIVAHCSAIRPRAG